jgi:hypothetical protein
MRTLRVLGFSFFAFLARALAMDEFLDRLGETLTITALDDRLRARLRGTLDFEFYYLNGPAPSLIFTDDNFLLNPRLSVYLDAQLGTQIYVFAQTRVDRGFDPNEGDAEARADEYAVRVSPWQDGRFSLQFGKFATVVGNWVARHYSWDNPFVTAPLPYENLTAIWDSVAAKSSATLLTWAHVRTKAGDFSGDEFSDRHKRLPIIWGPSYASGVSMLGRIGKVDYAVELKNTSLSSRPQTWDAIETQWQHPTFSGRIGFRPNEMWNFGVSASTGTYLRPEAEPTLAAGHSLDDYRQIVIAQDIGFAWRHLQVWAEFYETRFEIPNVGDVDTFAYYLEAKYRITPQLFGALRWNQQVFGTVRDSEGNPATWGRDVWRIDSAVGYRFTAHTQLKLQYSLQHEDSGPREYGHMVAAQFTIRF